MWPVAAILMFHALVATVYSLVIPLGEGPDEVPHYRMARFIAAERRLPVGLEAGSEGVQPPLYYVLGALVTVWIPEGDLRVQNNPDFSLASEDRPQNVLIHGAAEDWPYRGGALAWHLIRCVSVLLGTLTVAGVYQIGWILAPGRRDLALVGAAFVACLPGFISISAVVNNDSAVFALSTWSLALMAQAVSQKAPARLLVWAGALSGLAILAKTSALALVVDLLLAAVLFTRAFPRFDKAPSILGLRFLRARRLDQRMLSRSLTAALPCPEAKPRTMLLGVVSLAVSAAICAWWFLRNARLYGDPLAWNFKLASSDAVLQRPGFGELLHGGAGLLESFWGKFGGAVHLKEPQLVYWAGSALMLLAVAGWLLRRGQVRPVAMNRAALALLVVHATVTLVAYARWSSALMGADQARLLMPAIGAIALAITAGVARAVPRRSVPFVQGGLLCATAVVALATPAWSISPVFAAPGTIPTLPDGWEQVAPPSRQSSIVLMGALLPEEPTAPGETAIVGLAWKTVQAPGVDVRVRLAIQTADGQIVFAKEGTPSAGRDTTEHWQAGDLRLSTHALPLPQNAPTGIHRLTVTILDPMTGEPAATPLIAGDLEVGENHPNGQLFQPMDAQLGDFRLTGVSIAPSGARGVVVSLRWQAVQRVRAPSFTVFVHLYSAEGRLVAQHDGLPQAGGYPSSLWRPGETVWDSHLIAMPQGIAGGTFRLTAGLYDASSGQRLGSLSGDEIALGEWTVP